jgi:hypothetical protein
MPSLATIRTTLRDTIQDAITDLSGYATVPEVANLPAFVVIPRTANFNVAFARGQDTYAFDVLVLTARRDDELAQLDLDDYINGFGPLSVREAIWNAKAALLALGMDVNVGGWSDYGAQFAIGDIPHVGARLTVQVNTTGTA